jgi:hypothetical protein
VRITSRAAFGLGLFVGVAGLVLWFTAHERTGATMLGVTSIGFLYIALVIRGAAREADEAPEPPSAAAEKVEEEEVIAPTIWPFGFSVASVVLVLGLVVQRWLLIAGAVLFLACAAGWYNDIRRQHAHGSNHEHPSSPNAGRS